MYAREVEGRLLTFGVSGKLYRNALIMYDRETDSLWSHVLGVAVSGPLKGKTLTALAATQTTWKEWKEAYPHTRVLSKRLSPYGNGYAGDRYEEYYRSSRTGIRPLQRESSRLPAKERVVGIRVGSRSKAYPFSLLEARRLVEDELGGTSLLVVFDPRPQRGSVFNRAIKGRRLSFTLDGKTGEVIDRETGSRWDSITGAAKSGPLKGEQLRRIPSHYAFWFGWYEYFPDTEVAR